MLNDIPVLLTDSSCPELRRISFADYSAQCEFKSEHNLELVHILFAALDEQYSRDLIYAFLHKHNPAVFLLTVAESTGRLRRDWPWVSDATLDLIEERCGLFLGHDQPAHEKAVAELLSGAFISMMLGLGLVKTLSSNF